MSISVNDAHTSGSATPTLPSAESFDEYLTVSPADVALFALGSHVSIISDTSQRGYMSNRVLLLQLTYLRMGHISTMFIKLLMAISDY